QLVAGLIDSGCDCVALYGSSAADSDEPTGEVDINGGDAVDPADFLADRGDAMAASHAGDRDGGGCTAHVSLLGVVATSRRGTKPTIPLGGIKSSGCGDPIIGITTEGHHHDGRSPLGASTKPPLAYPTGVR